MNIGILTFYRANNYGAMLQCYSLVKNVRKYNMDTEVIDYVAPGIEEQYSNKHLWRYGLKVLASHYIKMFLRSKKNSRFESFRMLIPHSVPYEQEELTSTNDKYDCFIVGSDQVWNFKSNHEDEMFFLPFVTSNKKKYSYAASFGSDAFDSSLQGRYKKLLEGFQRISIREISGKEYVLNKLHLPCTVNIDPVFLSTSQEWGELADQIGRIVENKYILVYQLLKSERMISYAKKLASDRNIKVVIISLSLYRDKSFIDKSDVGPIEFLNLFKYSDAVITDSFHGTAFALLFEKELFLDFHEKSRTKTRLDSLSDVLSFGNRWISGGKLDPIDFSVVNKAIQHERQIGIEYIKEICKNNQL